MRYLILIFIISSFLYSNQNDLKPVSLQLKWKHQFQFAGFYMAKELGYYKDVGLDVQLKEFTKNLNIVNEIKNNSSDFGIDDSSLIYHKLNAENIVALFPIFQTSPITLITQENLQNLNSLQNKNIEFSTNELVNISIKAVLKSNNLNINQIPHTFQIDKFIAKESDGIVAYTSNQPFYLDEKNIKYNIFNPKDFGFDFYGDILFSSKEFTQNNPKLVSDFIYATKKGWDYAFSNIPETVDFIYKNYNTQNKSKESLLYEANVLKKLSGFDEGNFGIFEEKRVKEIGNVITLLFPQKYINTNLNDFIWNEKEELKNYYKNSYLKNNDTFTVCVHDNMFPVDGINNGKLTGISGDILNKIATQFDLKLIPIQAKNFKDYLQNASSGKCDILTATAEEGYKQYKNMNRSNFYLDSNLVIVTKIDKPFMENNQFLGNKKFITKYEIFEKYLFNLYPNLKVTVNNNIKETISKLENDEIDGYILDNITADMIIQNFGYGKFKISGFLGNEKPIRGAFGVIKNKPELLEIINLGLNNFDKKELEHIKESWKVTRYSTIIDYELIWKLVAIFIVILLFVFAFMMMLKRHNKELNEWLNSTIEGIAIFKNGKLVKANKQLLLILGYKNFSEIYGKTHFDFIVPWEHHIIKDKLPFNQEPYEMTFIKKDGTKFDALVKGHQMDNKNLRISTIIDISELKNAQRKLNKLNINLEHKIQEELEKNRNQQTIMFQQSKLAEMGMMLNMIAHQWRQPLNNISLIVNTIILKQKKEQLNLEQLNKFKNEFQQQITYLSNTIDDFKNFFKPKKEKEHFKLRDTILTTYSLIKPIFDKNHIQFNFNIDSQIKYFGYKNEFSQVILNIINNSKDALIEKNIENKLIDISVNEDEKNLIIIIQDNAKGVQEANLKKIFELYFSTKNSINGSGLGLYISKIIINEHFNGEIIAYNGIDGLEIIIKIPRNESINLKK
jgi:PAS domain S-box-containing protein